MELKGELTSELRQPQHAILDTVEVGHSVYGSNLSRRPKGIEIAHSTYGAHTTLEEHLNIDVE